MTTLNCRATRTLMMAYLDSELDAATTVSVREHLTTCTTCAQRFEREERLEAALAEQLREGTMPDDVAERLAGALQRPPRVLSAGGARWRWLAAAAVLLAAVWLVVRDATDAGEPASGLVHQLIAAWEEAASRPVPAVLEGHPATRSLLEEHDLASLVLPGDGAVDGHSARLLGARQEAFHGVRAVNLLYDCCGALTSVFVMHREALDSLPEALRPVPDGERAEVDGVRARTLLRDGLFIGVVSRHPSALASYWSG